MQYRLWLITGALLRHVPLRLAYAAATAAGNAAFYLWPRGRANTIDNFRRVLAGANEASIRRTARTSLVNYCKYLVDFARMPLMPPRMLMEAAKGDDSFQGLDTVLARGRGAIIVCMHFGNWDLGAAAAAARGYSLNVVAEDFGDERLTRAVVEAREALGMRVLLEGRTTPSLVRSLRANGLLALLIDRPLGEGGVAVEFFGGEVRVPEGPARLALRTGAPLVPVAFPRERANRVGVRVLASFDTDREGTVTGAADVASLTRAMMRAQEEYIRAWPDQWYMFRRMWGSADV